MWRKITDEFLFSSWTPIFPGGNLMISREMLSFERNKKYFMSEQNFLIIPICVYMNKPELNYFCWISNPGLRCQYKVNALKTWDHLFNIMWFLHSLLSFFLHGPGISFHTSLHGRIKREQPNEPRLRPVCVKNARCHRTGPDELCVHNKINFSG